ncbi:DUF1858 domain-containing protein [Proteiniphilum sp. X52]|uniref:DUF1858 domain-containing protein n=1 Tax=Proteiniphilum sp. X52 TaxID=2382159 RepID=UPI001314571B|nr:DUF1858 domain-containing protein [Proteiniphilum sp. X52]
MTINKYTPIHKITTAYPQLIPLLIKRNNRFGCLNKPVSPWSPGYLATVGNIAAAAGEKEEELVAFLEEEIKRIEIQYRY